MSALVERLEKGLQGVVDDLAEEIEALGEKVEDRVIEMADLVSTQADLDRLILAVVDHVERGLIDRDELLRIAQTGDA